MTGGGHGWPLAAAVDAMSSWVSSATAVPSARVRYVHKIAPGSIVRAASSTAASEPVYLRR